MSAKSASVRLSSERRHPPAEEDTAPPLAWLPAPLRAVAGFLYLDGVSPADDFLARLQKLAIATGVLIAPCTAVYAATNVWQVQANEGGYRTTGQYVSAVFNFGLPVTWLACFAVHKAAPSVPLHWVTVAWVLGTYLCIVMLTLSYPDYPCAHMFVQLAMLALSLRTRFGYGMVAAAAAGYALAAYNEAAILPASATESLPLASLPEPYRFSAFWQRFRGQANEYAVYFIIFACLEMQLREAGRLTAASRATAQLAAELAHALSRYDTELAARRLDEARASLGRNAVGLLDAFEGIVDNLNSYRPHLPNWLLPRHCSGSGDSDSEGSLDSSHRSVPKAETGSNSSKSRSRHSSSQHGSGGALAGPSATIAGTDSSTAKLARVVLFQGTFDLLGDAATGDGDRHGTRSQYAAAAHGFVDRVFAVADKSAGAVHSFLGDQLFVSWNGAAPAVQPEVKAARFVRCLLDDPGHTAARFCGAVTSFSAHVVVAGHAQQRALALSPAKPGDTFPERAQRLAARFGTVLLDDRVWRAANHSLEFRGAGVIDVTKPFESIHRAHSAEQQATWAPLRPVFEVVGDLAARDEEWMYVLHQQQQQLTNDGALDATGAVTNPNTALCNAVAALCEGKRDVALRIIDTVRGTDAAQSPIIAALIDGA